MYRYLILIKLYNKKEKNKQDVVAMKASVTKGNCNMQKR